MIKLLLSFATVLFTFASFAQNLPTRTNPSDGFRMTYQDYSPTTRAAGDSCGYMANAYLAIDKAGPGVWWNGPYFGASTGIPSYTAGGQYFTSPQDMKIGGFQFLYYFVPETTADSIPVVGTIYQALADSTPGAEVGRDTIWVSQQTPGFGIANYATFSFDNQPNLTTGGFFLSARVYTNDSLYFLSNVDGQVEDLSYVYYEDIDVPTNSVWTSYLTWTWDFDHLFFPIFKTEFTNDFSFVSDTICRGSDVCVDMTNIAPIVFDSLWNRYDGNDTLYLGWKIDGNIGGANMRSYCDIPGTGGSVNVSMMDTISFFNDVSGKCPIVVTKQVFVVDSVSADFTFVDQLNGLIDFTNASANGDTYLWDFGDMNSSTDTNTSHTYATQAFYTVHLKSYNQCFEDSSIQVVYPNFVGINEFSFNEFNLYPNPTKGIVNITSSLSGEIIELSIINILGKVLLSKSINSNFEQINMNQFGQGTYFFRLTNKDKSITKKVVVQ